jgi:hypothetical protein
MAILRSESFAASRLELTAEVADPIARGRAQLCRLGKPLGGEGNSPPLRRKVHSDLRRQP